ncbi:MAG: glycerophosphodiester phosphodiesterase family protein [Bacteroidales bacterium]|nr:glycerophosphodiester phosphodiesterase family protein [Bacteroidales bacterium]
MKRILLSITLITAVLVAFSCGGPKVPAGSAAKSLAILKDPSTKKVLVAAHRGDWRNYPENSIPAIESLIRMGADIMELDVKMTSDSVLVLCHDSKVDRTTNGKGPVSSYTLDSLKRLRLKRAHGVTTDSLHMPTLEEALLVCKDRILVNVDQGSQWFPQVIAVAEKVGCSDQILFKKGGTRAQTTEFGKSVVEAGMTFMPIVSIDAQGSSPTIDSYLDGGPMPEIFEVCFSKDNELTEAKIRQLSKAGTKIWVNSIWGSLCGYLDDDRAYQSQQDADLCYGKLIDLGFKVFQTDRPEYLLQYLRKRNLHD